MRKAMALFLAAVLCAGGSASAAEACEGSTVVFEDDFKDDAGGWAIGDDIEVKDGSFVIKLGPDGMESNLNITHTVHDADICSEAVWPEGESKILGAGLLFWGEDTRTYFQFGILNNGKFWIARRYDGKWHTVVENVPSRAIDTKPGAVNKLRVKASGIPPPSTSTAPRCGSCAASRRRPAGASASPATISTRTSRRK